MTDQAHKEQLCSEYTSRLSRTDDLRTYRERYESLSLIFRDILVDLTSHLNFTFSGIYARSTFVADRLPAGTAKAMRSFRIFAKSAKNEPETKLQARYAADRQMLATLIETLKEGLPTSAASAPEQPSVAIAADTTPDAATVKGPWKTVRVCAKDKADGNTVIAEIVDDGTTTTIDMSEHHYLLPLVARGTVLNLLHYNGKLTHIVYEPDFLVDVTTIAGCITASAVTHELALINKLKPYELTPQMLLGNLSGQILDDCLNAMRNGKPMDMSKASYDESARKFFRANAVGVATTDGLDLEWHKAAQEQMRNVSEMLTALKNGDPRFDAKKAITEPSFISSELGIQGRMDMLQTDFGVLVEQKSGKRDEYRHTHREEHYAQIVIYKLMLEVSHGVSNGQGSRYLMYSRYRSGEGLMNEGGTSPTKLINIIITLRNGIVYNELRFRKTDNLRKALEGRHAEFFRRRPVSDNLWGPWVKPQLDSLLEPINKADETTKAYYFEMLAFMQRENVLARMGGSSHGRDGFSSLWTSTADERAKSGEMIAGLSFARAEVDKEDDSDNEMSVAVLTLPSQTEEGTAAITREINFRPGDPVILYHYPTGGEPAPNRVMENRATLLSMTEMTDGTMEFSVRLRSAVPLSFMQSKDCLWALDHDLLESSNTSLMRNLTTLLRTPKERRALLLGTRVPKVGRRVTTLSRDYGEMNEMMRRQAAAKDIFLLVGPPGTGKTSVGLMNILREELSQPSHSVLLLSYTNRAVDEICSKLEKDGLEYIRIGSRHSCAKEYREKLLSSLKPKKASELRDTIAGARIVVTTTASLNANIAILGIRTFDLAIVDEASQILEPNIMGIFSATLKSKSDGASSCPSTDSGELSIGRIVLIGDEKQLPAVVAQDKMASQVSDSRLHDIGLTDCRDSFFERMMRLYGNDERLTYRLKKHARMHQEVANFANKMFYANELTAFLPRQSEPLGTAALPGDDALTRQIAQHRCLFFDSAPNDGSEAPLSELTTEKTNLREAAMVAKIALAVMRLRRRSGLWRGAEESLGIVVPYRNQIRAIRSEIANQAANDDERDALKEMTIDTVERLQGSERDIIIYGFTVNKLSQLKFLTDSQFKCADGTLIDRKLNVALTRAREQNIVVGNARTISEVQLYKQLMNEMTKGEM